MVNGNEPHVGLCSVSLRFSLSPSGSAPPPLALPLSLKINKLKKIKTEMFNKIQGEFVSYNKTEYYNIKAERKRRRKGERELIVSKIELSLADEKIFYVCL